MRGTEDRPPCKALSPLQTPLTLAPQTCHTAMSSRKRYFRCCACVAVLGLAQGAQVNRGEVKAGSSLGSALRPFACT